MTEARKSWRNLIPSAKYGAHRTGSGLSGTFVSPALAKLAGAADALARRSASIWRPGTSGWRHSFPTRCTCAAKQRHRRQPLRPEVSVCLDCLSGLLEAELAAYPGRVVAFEPDGETFTQYFFVGRGRFRGRGPASRSGCRDRKARRHVQRPVQRLRRRRPRGCGSPGAKFPASIRPTESRKLPALCIARNMAPQNCARL